MDMDWKYKVDLLSPNFLNKLSSEFSLDIPQSIKEFISEHNGATPVKYRFMVHDIERICGSVLDFNDDVHEGDSAKIAYISVACKYLVPFAIDPFGNYICFDTSSQQILFFNHEDSAVEYIADTIAEFLSMLY